MEGKIYVYENTYSDKGIIIADTLEEAQHLWQTKYPKRRLYTRYDVYKCLDDDNGGMVFSDFEEELENHKLYCTVPW